MPDYPTPPIAEILGALVEAVHQFGHWREIESGCGGAGYLWSTNPCALRPPTER